MKLHPETCAPRRRGCGAVAAMIALVLSAGGCSRTVHRTTSDDRPMPTPPREAPITPAGTDANAVALRVAPKPRDTNGNGYPDLIMLEAYLFAEPHPTPFFEDGTFVFTLFMSGESDRPGAVALREWRVGGEELARSKVVNTLFGPTYGIALSLLDGGEDYFPIMAADLTCRFEPADGRPPIVRREIHKLQIGSPLATAE